MAAVDHYSTIITTNISMDGFSSDHFPPLDLSDYIVTDEVPEECSGPTSAEQLPIQGLVSTIAEASNATSSHSANYVDNRSSGGGGGSNNHNTRQVIYF